MIAAVYAHEIAEQFTCADCAASPAKWERLGRCTGEIPLGFETVSLVVRDHKNKRDVRMAYPGPDGGGRGWAQCPMGWLREDLRPEARTARIVSHAMAADYDKRWPDVLNRMYQLVLKWRNADAAKDRARFEAEREVANRG